MTSQLTIEDVVKLPRPGAEGPRNFVFTADSQRVFYQANKPGSYVQNLFSYNLTTGETIQLSQVDEATATESVFSRPQKLYRERSRNRFLGVTGFQLVEPKESQGELTILANLNGALYLWQERANPNLTKLEGSQGALNARLSPDGQKVAFVRQGNLYFFRLENPGQISQLTFDDETRGITGGEAEFVAQEEMGRLDGFWWGPDSQKIAFQRNDGSAIPPFFIVHNGDPDDLLETQRYPMAGQTNASVELGLLELPSEETGAPLEIGWFDLNPGNRLTKDPGEDSNSRPQPLVDGYLVNVSWQGDGKLSARVMSRNQQHLTWLVFKLASGERSVLLEEAGQPWLNLHRQTAALKNDQMLWGSERDGYRHLYLLDEQGHVVRQLTKGDWIVTGLGAVDEEKRLVYFTATRESPLERHFYAVSLDGGEPVRLTSESGWHDVSLSPDNKWLLDRWSNLEQPARVVLSANPLALPDEAKAEPVTFFANLSLTPDALGVQPPELISFPAADGTLLYGAVYKPEHLEADRQYPLIVAVYGGPGSQDISRTWEMTADLRAQYLSQQGFVVLKVDNRGTSNRGMAFEGQLAGRFGKLELADQLAGIEYLTSRGYVDQNRIGVYGWSYGGFMTLTALLNAPNIFKVGVAGAPVTDYLLYDTFYTERYLGQPAENRQGYEATSVLPLVENLQGRLLLVHGLVDENVHFQNSSALIDQLTQAGKEFDLLVLPEERHSVRAAVNSGYFERRLFSYFKQYL